MFGNTPFNQPVNSWNTANVTSMRSMFNNARSFNQPVNDWNTAKVTDMGEMFRSASDFN
ncbi:MAG: BspA family leucine-rich repeat surface protein, partial [Dehalococcoidia bacterium]